MAHTKADKDNVGESLKDDDFKETKAEKENTSKNNSAAFVEQLSCMKKVYMTMFLFLNFHNNCTILVIQFNVLKSLLCNTQVEIIQL